MGNGLGIIAAAWDQGRWRGVGLRKAEGGGDRHAAGEGLQLGVAEGPDPEMPEAQAMLPEEVGHSSVANRRPNGYATTRRRAHAVDPRSLVDHRERRFRPQLQEPFDHPHDQCEALDRVETTRDQDVARRLRPTVRARAEPGEVDGVREELGVTPERPHRAREIGGRVVDAAGSSGDELDQVSERLARSSSPDIAPVAVEDERPAGEQPGSCLPRIVEVDDIERALPQARDDRQVADQAEWRGQLSPGGRPRGTGPRDLQELRRLAELLECGDERRPDAGDVVHLGDPELRRRLERKPHGGRSLPDLGPPEAWLSGTDPATTPAHSMRIGISW